MELPLSIHNLLVVNEFTSILNNNMVNTHSMQLQEKVKSALPINLQCLSLLTDGRILSQIGDRAGPREKEYARLDEHVTLHLQPQRVGVGGDSVTSGVMGYN
ncbi:hypothetical protein J6590_090769 [Homalodisca vitripennis]|nr:hypothetical protein J6590_090769 [Homalodisca vitripennis]